MPGKKGWLVQPAPGIHLAAGSALSSPGSPGAPVLPALGGHITLLCCWRLLAHLNNDSEGFLGSLNHVCSVNGC